MTHGSPRLPVETPPLMQRAQHLLRSPPGTFSFTFGNQSRIRERGKPAVLKQERKVEETKGHREVTAPLCTFHLYENLIAMHCEAYNKVSFNINCSPMGLIKDL